MHASQIMTQPVTTVAPGASIVEAANLMLQRHISGLPVVDASGALVGVVSEADFIRRSEIGTGKIHGRWLRFLLGPGKEASEFVLENARKVEEVMTCEPRTVAEDTSLEEIVELMQRYNIKRVPVMRGKTLVGIVTRSNLLQAVAALASDIPGPTAADDDIRTRIIATIESKIWRPFGLSVVVRNGIVQLGGVITNESARMATCVAAENVLGVREVHDHLCWVDAMSGMYLNSREDEAALRAS